jgi:hypothetical protein
VHDAQDNRLRKRGKSMDGSIEFERVLGNAETLEITTDNNLAFHETTNARIGAIL